MHPGPRSTAGALLPVLQLLQLLAAAAATAIASATGPMLLFGPTANLNSTALSALIDGLVATPADLAQWKMLRQRLAASPGGGALHLRQEAFSILS